MFDVIIIGAGAAGLFASSRLEGLNTLVIEKEDEIGKKLRITGLSKCNLTHVGNVNLFKKHYNKFNYIKYALTTFSNIDLREYLEKRGLKTVIKDEKVFPASMKAADVVGVLSKNIKVNTSERVVEIIKKDSFIIRTNKSEYQAKNVIVATGGITYKVTGCTEDSLVFAKNFNIKYENFSYALCPIYAKEHKISSLMGMSFDVSIDHYRKKKLNTLDGSLLITHFGYSGPIIINYSRNFLKEDELYINFLKRSREEFSSLLLKDIKESPKKSIKTVLLQYTQKRLVEFILQKNEIENVNLSELKKIDREHIINDLINYKVIIARVGKENNAMISKGGIDTNELNKKTFMSKKCDGLYFIGECVDIDGDTGGYNLQYAFSSAYLASENIRSLYVKD